MLMAARNIGQAWRFATDLSGSDAEINKAVEAGKKVRVLADETRPFLQGARLTAWEMADQGIDVTVIPDSAAATVLRRGLIDVVITGADRIAANGDVANKIGTYGLALHARSHGVRFMVVAPTSTLDLATPDGAGIPIETRGQGEVLGCGGQSLAAEGAAGGVNVNAIAPGPVLPPPEALRSAQDRLAEKRLFDELQIPLPHYRAVEI